MCGVKRINKSYWRSIVQPFSVTLLWFIVIAGSVHKSLSIKWFTKCENLFMWTSLKISLESHWIDSMENSKKHQPRTDVALIENHWELSQNFFTCNYEDLTANGGGKWSAYRKPYSRTYNQLEPGEQREWIETISVSRDINGPEKPLSIRVESSKSMKALWFLESRSLEQTYKNI